MKKTADPDAPVGPEGKRDRGGLRVLASTAPSMVRALHDAAVDIFTTETEAVPLDEEAQRPVAAVTGRRSLAVRRRRVQAATDPSGTEGSREVVGFPLSFGPSGDDGEPSAPSASPEPSAPVPSEPSASPVSLQPGLPLADVVPLLAAEPTAPRPVPTAAPPLEGEQLTASSLPISHAPGLSRRLLLVGLVAAGVIVGAIVALSGGSGSTAPAPSADPAMVPAVAGPADPGPTVTAPAPGEAGPTAPAPTPKPAVATNEATEVAPAVAQPAEPAVAEAPAAAQPAEPAVVEAPAAAQPAEPAVAEAPAAAQPAEPAGAEDGSPGSGSEGTVVVRDAPDSASPADADPTAHGAEAAAPMGEPSETEAALAPGAPELSPRVQRIVERRQKAYQREFEARKRERLKALAEQARKNREIAAERQRRYKDEFARRKQERLEAAEER